MGNEETAAKVEVHSLNQTVKIGQVQIGGKQTSGNDICMTTGITVQYHAAVTLHTDTLLARDCRGQVGRAAIRVGCSRCVAGVAVQRDNVLSSTCD